MDTARKLATYEDLLALPEDVRAEVLGGQLEVLPRPLPRHSFAQAGLARGIGGPFDEDDGRGGPGGWWILQEVDVRLGPHDIVQPDIAGWRRTRLVDPWDMQPIDVVPDWVCEVLSPSNRRRDRIYKSDLYARCGVPYYWLVDPEARTLEVFRLHDGKWLRLGGYDEDSVARIEPFEAVEFAVDRLFPPRPSAT